MVIVRREYQSGEFSTNLGAKMAGRTPLDYARGINGH
jgi:hypothetical protein